LGVGQQNRRIKMSEKMNKFMFEVPNDKEGEYFIYLINKFLNKNTYTMRKKARGERAKKAIKDGLSPRSYDSFLPIRHAQRFQLYFDSALENETIKYLRDKVYKNDDLSFNLKIQINNNAENLEKFRNIKRIIDN
jgi:hypothetical protein